MPGGLLWTVRVPDDSVQVDLARGIATFRLDDFPIPDFGKIPNGLMHGPSKPARVSFEIRWRGIIGRQRLNDVPNGFALEGIETGATISWSARMDGFTFSSDPAATSKSAVALIGRERNGIFAGAASGEWPPLSVSGNAVADGKTATYTYWVRNLSSGDVAGIDVRARIPAGGDVVDSWFAQPGHFPGSNNGFDVQWAAPVGTVGAGESVGPFTLVVSVPNGTHPSRLQSLGWVQFTAPVTGSAVSGWLAGAPPPTA